MMCLDRETTKLHAVYVSTRGDCPSLNDCLHSGPKFDQKILGILLQFRTHEIAMTVKAFLQITEKDRHTSVPVSGWCNQAKPRDSHVLFHMTSIWSNIQFISTQCNTAAPCTYKGSPWSAFKQYRQTYYMYIDDVTSGSETEADGYQFYEKAKDILKEVAFNPWKFCVNSTALQETIDSAKGLSTDQHRNYFTKVLRL